MKWLERIVKSIDRTVSCEGKVKYNRRETSIRAASAMKAKGVDGLEEYKCRHCKAYHVGHKWDS